MPINFRIAAFNAENLFSRAKLLNLNDHQVGDAKLNELHQLQTELRRLSYNKASILQLYRRLKNYIKIEETRGKLFRRQGFSIVGVKANGVRDWDGHIVLKRAQFNDIARKNTAKVIRNVNAHVMCLVEVESRPVLHAFNQERLYSKKYSYNMLIDGNDVRGIDVALLTRFGIGGLWTHIFDRKGNSRIFSRDCLEAQVKLPNGSDLWVLVNHLKSKGYGTQAKNNARRKLQAQRIAEILSTEYDLRRELVVVAGDLNDVPDSDALQPLIGLPRLHDVLALKFPNSSESRWTYRYRTNQQIDYLLVSEPLKQAFRNAGVERHGMYDVHKYSQGAIRAWSSVQNNGYTAAASDHGAVWADFRL